MARYPAVAHRTAKSPKLAAKLKGDLEARFVLLVPAVPPPGWVCGENGVRKKAEEEAQAAKAGDISSLLAPEELLAHP
jgi:hypothetical protein